MELIFLLTGITIGIIAAWFIQKYRLSSTEKAFNEKINLLNNELQLSRNESEKKSTEIITLTKNLASATTDNNHLQNKLTEQKEELNRINEKLQVEFRNLANSILEEKSKKFTEQNQANLDQLLKPLNEKLKDFEKKVEETYDKEAQQRFSLKEEVKRLAELNQVISQEAHNLTKALKGDSKTQGNWGEVILENILEKSGLTKDREYFIQKSFTTDDGRRLQPDVVVAYPGERSIVIDSKVSLVAYEKLTIAVNTDEQQQAIKEHLASIKRHIDDLSSKAYHTLYELKSLDFVMLFMPVEPAYMIAVQNDPGLWNYAYEKRILLISPTNLIAAMKMVESMWRQENQNKNAEEIARQAGNLYDKFEGLMTDLIELGKRINGIQEYYKTSMNKLTDGKGSLVSRIENIRKLGAKNKKNLPQSILNRVEEIDKNDD